VQCVYGFYASGRQSGGEFEPGSSMAIGDTLTITALGVNAVFVNRLINQNGVKLPVSYYGEVDSLEFKFKGDDGEGRDTVYIAKQNIAHLDDVSCPAHMWHHITHVFSTHHLIDSVLISEPEINYEGNENLQIYFRTAQE